MLWFCRSSPLSGPAQRGSQQRPIIILSDKHRQLSSTHPDRYIITFIYKSLMWMNNLVFEEQSYIQSYMKDKQFLA